MIRNPLPSLALLSALFLAACGTPLEQCARAATADLRALETERAERARNLERGHALVQRPVLVFGPRICPHPVTGVPTACPGALDRWETEIVPINRRIEARRIELLDQMIAEERSRTAAALADCRHRFPEG